MERRKLTPGNQLVTGSQVSAHSDTRLRAQKDVTQLSRGRVEEGNFTTPRNVGKASSERWWFWQE